MTPIEIIALIFVIIGLIKMIVLFINPANWMKVVDKVYSNSAVTMIVGLVLAVVILNYLLAELTIVQIFAAMAFLGALMMINFASYGKETVTWANKLLKDKNMMKRSWLSIVVWIALMLWVLYALFV